VEVVSVVVVVVSVVVSAVAGVVVVSVVVSAVVDVELVVVVVVVVSSVVVAVVVVVWSVIVWVPLGPVATLLSYSWVTIGETAEAAAVVVASSKTSRTALRTLVSIWSPIPRDP